MAPHVATLRVKKKSYLNMKYIALINSLVFWLNIHSEEYSPFKDELLSDCLVNVIEPIWLNCQ